MASADPVSGRRPASSWTSSPSPTTPRTTTRSAAGSRPAAVAAAWIVPMASEIARRSCRLALIQPSAIRPTRRSAASAEPPSRIGGAGRCTGLGSIRAGGTSVNSPWNSTGSSAQSARSAATYSAVWAPRRAKVAPTAANSWGAQPDPSPTSSRPRHSTSTVASCLARIAAGTYGALSTATPSRGCSVTAAANPRATTGSSTARYCAP